MSFKSRAGAAAQPVSAEVSLLRHAGAWLAPVAATLLVIFHLGYSYGEPSHYIFLPWVLHRIDPSVLANDWFVNTIPHHFNSIRFMAWAARWTPLPVAMLVVHVLSLFLLLWVARRIIDRLFGDGRVFWVALFLLLRWGTDGLGGNGLWGNYLVQHTAAVPVCLLAFYLALESRPIAAAVACAAATWIHVQLGALTMLVLGLGMLVSWRDREAPDDTLRFRRILLAGGVYLLAVAPTVIEQWVLYMGSSSPLSAADYVYIHGVMRHPHHLIPSSWWGSEFYRFFLLMGMGALAGEWRRRPHRTILTWVAIIAALCVVGTVFVEVTPVKLITKLQLFRMTIFVKFFAVAYVARFLLGALEGQGALAKICVLAILTTVNFSIVGVCALVIFALRQSRRWLWAMGLLAAGWIAGVAMVGSTARGIPMFWHHFGLSARDLWTVAAATAAVGLVLWRSVRFVPAALLVLLVAMRWWTGLPSYSYNGPPADEWYKFCQQVKARTAGDAVFITPPFLGGFQLLAERAEVANFKCVPLIETDLMEWKRRLEDLSGWSELRCSGWVDCGSKLAGGYYGLRDTDFLRLSQKYRVQYVVTCQPEHRLGFPVEFRLGDFTLYRLPVP